MPLAVATTLVCPELLVDAVLGLSAAEAPEPGAEKTTDAARMALPKLSLTVATRGAANALPVKVACPPPLVATSEAAAPGLLVSAKLAGVVTPGALAVTA